MFFSALPLGEEQGQIFGYISSFRFRNSMKKLFMSRWTWFITWFHSKTCPLFPGLNSAKKFLRNHFKIFYGFLIYSYYYQFRDDIHKTLLSIIIQSFSRLGCLRYKRRAWKDCITLLIRHPHLNYDCKKFINSFVDTTSRSCLKTLFNIIFIIHRAGMSDPN
jgi:hypothetical protein